MRVLVVATAIGGHSALAAATQIADGWRQAGPVDLAVLPMGSSGCGLVEAFAALHGSDVVPVGLAGGLATLAVNAETVLIAPVLDHSPGFDTGASSQVFGQAISAALDLPKRPRRLIVDLGANTAHDAGAGLLDALGATANQSLTAGADGLGQITTVDLSGALERIAGVDLMAVVPPGQCQVQLLGLAGITARVGQKVGLDPGRMLAIDANLSALAAALGVGVGQQPGDGASGGTGCAIRALGGELTYGFDLMAAEAGLAGTIAAADLLVVGTNSFDFHHQGGECVPRLAEWAGRRGIGCVLVASEVVISNREMRTMGIDAAYTVDPNELCAGVARIARSWIW